MRPSDSPAASPRLRSALGRALPVGQALFLCTSTFPSRHRPPVRLPPTARRRGSPVLRRPDPPTGRSGVSQVTGPSSLSVPLATHPAGLPSTRLHASGNTAFQAKNPLSTGILCHFGADTGGPLTRLATLQPPPHEDGCNPGYQPAGYALAGWGSHPQDDSSEFQPTSQPPLRPALPGRFHQSRVLVLAAAVGSLLAAVRAARVDPIQSLRSE